MYGTNFLIENKKLEIESTAPLNFDFETILLREQISEGIKALYELNKLGESYGFDLTRPAENAREAVQWTYLA